MIIQNLIASWQDASAASQQELDDVGRQLLAAALNTNPWPHEIPLWPLAIYANPVRRSLNIVNTYPIMAKTRVNFCRKNAQKKYVYNRKCPRKPPAVSLVMRPSVRAPVSVLLDAVAVSRPEVVPGNAVVLAKI